MAAHSQVPAMNMSQ